MRGAIVCGECHKPRCIYSKTKLSQEQSTYLDIIIECDLYTCGASLFACDTSYTDTIVVREALVCSSCIETQYYSSVLVHFPPVCYYCGVPEEALVNDDTIRELEKSHAVVYPICFLCLSDRKKSHCKQPSNMARQKAKVPVKLTELFSVLLFVFVSVYMPCICSNLCMRKRCVVYACACDCLISYSHIH